MVTGKVIKANGQEYSYHPNFGVHFLDDEIEFYVGGTFRTFFFTTTSPNTAESTSKSMPKQPASRSTKRQRRCLEKQKNFAERKFLEMSCFMPKTKNKMEKTERSPSGALSFFYGNPHVIPSRQFYIFSLKNMQCHSCFFIPDPRIFIKKFFSKSLLSPLLRTFIYRHWGQIQNFYTSPRRVIIFLAQTPKYLASCPMTERRLWIGNSLHFKPTTTNGRTLG